VDLYADIFGRDRRDLKHGRVDCRETRRRRQARCGRGSLPSPARGARKSGCDIRQIVRLESVRGRRPPPPLRLPDRHQQKLLRLGAVFYLMRHADTDWPLVNERHLVGAANDLAPLTEMGVKQVAVAIEQLRPLGIRLILTSPMTRALQTAALLCRPLDLPLAVEFDLHEWVPDCTYSWSTPDEVLALIENMRQYGGEWPVGEPRPIWEPMSAVRQRSLSVLTRYAGTTYPIAVVTHAGVVESLTGRTVDLTEILPYELPSPP
jgi:broad specificity phosphatase PhoE